MKRRIADTWLTVLTGLCLVVLAVSAVHGSRLWPDFDELGGVAGVVMGFPFVYLVIVLIGWVGPYGDGIADALDSLLIPFEILSLFVFLLQWLVAVPWIVERACQALRLDLAPGLRRRLSSSGAAFLTLGLAIYLVVDAITFRLMPDDPVSGRIRGCYSVFEVWVGSKQPTEWARQLQMTVALFLTPLSLGTFLWFRRLGFSLGRQLRRTTPGSWRA